VARFAAAGRPPELKGAWGHLIQAWRGVVHLSPAGNQILLSRGSDGIYRIGERYTLANSTSSEDFPVS
jgi:hypothetical protein